MPSAKWLARSGVAASAVRVARAALSFAPDTSRPASRDGEAPSGSVGQLGDDDVGTVDPGDTAGVGVDHRRVPVAERCERAVGADDTDLGTSDERTAHDVASRG